MLCNVLLKVKFFCPSRTFEKGAAGFREEHWEFASKKQIVRDKRWIRQNKGAALEDQELKIYAGEEAQGKQKVSRGQNIEEICKWQLVQSRV